MSRDAHTDSDRIVDEIRDVKAAIESLDLPALRDRFAIAALQVIMSDKRPSVTMEMMAKSAYEVADEMLKARGQGGTK